MFPIFARSTQLDPSHQFSIGRIEEGRSLQTDARGDAEGAGGGRGGGAAHG